MSLHAASPPSPTRRRPLVRGLTVAAAAFSCLFASLAYGQATLIQLGAVKEVYDCSTDGTVAIGSVSYRPGNAPLPRDAFDFTDVTWDLPITDLRYITINETTDKARQIAFPADELVDHLVTSIVLPRSSTARLVFINTSSLDDFGFPQRDAYVWYPDYTAEGDPTKADVVLVGSNLDLKCCSDTGHLAYLDDLAYVERFHRAQRGILGPDQYSLTRIQTTAQNSRGVPANEDVSTPEETVDCCSADGLIVYGRQFDYWWYRANETGSFRGEYTWVYVDSGNPPPGPTTITAINTSRSSDRVLVCTDDGQLAVAATQGRGSYHTWTPTLALQSGATPGAESIYPLEIRNNQVAFGHTQDSSGRDSPMVLNAPSETYTYLVLRPGHNQGEEVEADETISKVLGYSIKLNAQTGVEEERVLVRWIPALSSVELLSNVYGVDGVETLFCASRDITKLYAWIDNGVDPPKMFRVEQQPDPAPTPTTARITTNAAGTAEILTIVYSEDVVRNFDPTLELSGGPITATWDGVSSGHVLRYTLDRRVNYDETGTFDLAAGAVTDFSDQDNLEVLDQVLTNRSDFNRPPPDTTGPDVTGAAIDADGETLTLIFDETVRYVAVPTLSGFAKPVKVKAQGRRVSGNTITFPLSRIVYEGESGSYRLTRGSVTDPKGNPNKTQTGPLLNDSTVPNPDDPDPPKPPKDKVKTKRRPLGATANAYADAAYQTSAYFYYEPYTANAYYAYLSAYQALVYGYQAGTIVRYDGPKLPNYNQAIAQYKEIRYQQVINSYNSAQFAYTDYASTGSSTMLNTYVYSYYAYYYGNADLEAK